MYSSQLKACDETQLAIQFIGFYQKGSVKICPAPFDPRLSHLEEMGDPCARAILSTNQARAEQIIEFVKKRSGYDLKEVYHTWAFAHKPETEVRKHLDACPLYDSYVRVAVHMVSCYHHTGGEFIGYGNPAPKEAQAIGIMTCLRIGETP